MNNRILSFLLIFQLLTASGYAQSWKWAKAGGGSFNEQATDMVVDDQDNLYACGTFINQATFDGQTINASGANSFLIKYDSSGVKQWVFSFPGTLLRLSIDPNNSNNFLAAGTFSGTISIGTSSLVSNGLNDVFAFKFDQSGNISWATSWGGTANDDLQDIEYQVSGNFIATGTFNSSILFFKDGISLTATYDASVTNSSRAANLYAAHFRDVDGKAVLAFTKGVAPVFPIPANAPPAISGLRLQTDMRGHLGITTLVQSYPSSRQSTGSTYIGNTSLPYIYNILELDSTLEVKRTLLQANNSFNAFDEVTTQFANTHLDRNGEFYLVRSQNDLDVGGQTIGRRGYDEYMGSVNLTTLNSIPLTTNYAGCYTCDFQPPNFYPFGMYNNGIAKMTWPLFATVQSISAPAWVKNHDTNFGPSTRLLNKTGNKVYVAGYFASGNNSLDAFPLINSGGWDVYAAVLKIPDQPLKADAGIDRVKCAGNNTGVNIGGYPAANGGSGLPYTYSWSPATGLNNANLPYPLANPSVNTEYILTLTDGAGQIAKDTVAVFVNQSVASITPAGSAAFCQNGNVVLTAGVGASYLWSTGATTRSITVNTVGTYSVTIRDECGNTSTSFPVTVTMNALPDTPVVTANGLLAICTGSAVTLTAPAGYTYLWNNGATTQSITVDSAFNYRVTVLNAAGCAAQSASNTVTLWNPTIFPVISYASSSFCEGSTRSLTAPAGYSYLWNTGEVTRTIAASTGGAYTVTISSPAANCGVPQTSAPVQLTMNPRPPVPVITANGPLDYCNGDSVLLTAPPGYANYRWKGTYCCISGPQSIMAYGTTHNQVEVYYATGCYNTSAIVRTTTGSPPPVPTITANGPTTFCQGGAVTLTVHTGVINYLWSNGATTNSTTITTSGDYDVRVFNGGCGTTSLPVTVTVNPLPSIPTITASGPTTICSGGSVILSAPGGFTYLWSTGATTQSINVSTGGNYSVTVMNANSCSAVSAVTTVVVNSNPAVPAITANGPTTFCLGGSVTLTAPAGFTYLWSNGATSQSINVNTSGNYSVTISNTNNCSATSAATTITVNPLPGNPVISASGPTTFCQGGSVTLTAPLGFTYLWSNGATTQSINVSSPGSFSVTVSNANNCSAASATTIVTVNALPATPTITAVGPLTFCQGGSVALTSPAGFTYLWSNGATTQSILVHSSGNYSVTVRNANNCSATSAGTIVTVNPLPATPVITASGPTTFCQGGSVSLSAPAGFSYLWSNTATTQNINVSTSGNYTVTVTNANNCSVTSAATTVTVNALPPVPVITQAGNTLFSSSPTGNQWYFNGVIIAGATASGYSFAVGGDYSVTVINTAGCSSSSATFTAGRNGVVDLTATDHFYFNLFPNPVNSSQLTIEYQLEQQHTVGVSLFNMNGRRITIQRPVARAAGRYTLNANTIAERLWKGVYILEFRIDGKKVTRTIIKL